MELIEIHTQAENGHVSFDLPEQYASLANAKLLLVVMKDTLPAASTPVGQTDWDVLQRAYESFTGYDPYPAITDPVAWQRQLRADDEKEYDR